MQVSLEPVVYQGIQYLANKHQLSSSKVVNQLLAAALHWVAAPEDNTGRDSGKVTDRIFLSPANQMRIAHLHRVRDYRDKQHVVNDILQKSLEGILHREGII